jgi:hypothetical protein
MIAAVQHMGIAAAQRRVTAAVQHCAEVGLSAV